MLFFDSWCRTIQNKGLQRCRPFVYPLNVTSDVTSVEILFIQPVLTFALADKYPTC